MREAFRSYALERPLPTQRARSGLPKEGGSAVVLFPGLLPGIPAYTVKVHAKFPGRTPAIRGLIHLFDVETGELLAVMDSGHLSAVRTALAGAVAADVLARRDAGRVAIIGAGQQGAWGLRLLPLVREVQHVTVFDTAPFKTGLFARRLASELSAPLVPTNSLTDAVTDADIVVSATWAREPFLFSGMVTDGAHLTTLGPDEPGKCELGADLIEEGLFVCDDRALAMEVGAIGGAGLGESAVHAELGEVIAGLKPGREDIDQITIYGGVGLAWMDLVVAWEVYKRAQAEGAGQRVDFLA